MIWDTVRDTSSGLNCCWKRRPRYTKTLEVLVLGGNTDLSNPPQLLSQSELVSMLPQQRSLVRVYKGCKLTPGNSEPPSGPTGYWSGCPHTNGSRSCAGWPARARLPPGRPHPPRSWCWVVQCRRLDQEGAIILLTTLTQSSGAQIHNRGLNQEVSYDFIGWLWVHWFNKKWRREIKV